MTTSHKQKPARGRGNQGDHVLSRFKCATNPPHILDHNAQVEAKRQAKLAKRRKKT